MESPSVLEFVFSVVGLRFKAYWLLCRSLHVFRTDWSMKLGCLWQLGLRLLVRGAEKNNCLALRALVLESTAQLLSKFTRATITIFILSSHLLPISWHFHPSFCMFKNPHSFFVNYKRNRIFSPFCCIFTQASVIFEGIHTVSL